MQRLFLRVDFCQYVSLQAGGAVTSWMISVLPSSQPLASWLALTALWTLLWDGRFSLLTGILAGFGRASAEVGAVIMVGGNMHRVTRVVTTTIALETSKGNLPLALALGMILMLLVLAVNAAAVVIRDTAKRVYG